ISDIGCLEIQGASLGIAYAIWSGVGIVLISLLSWGLFGQRLDLPAIIGMMLICAGVLVINLLSRSTPH
ncbi:TPA: SMR family transporter, partial [Escherichia coli]